MNALMGGGFALLLVGLGLLIWGRRKQVLLAVLPLVVLGLVVLIVGVYLKVSTWDRSCKAHGGHSVSAGQGLLCVSSDGRVVEPR